jgi:hypothetical protein
MPGEVKVSSLVDVPEISKEIDIIKAKLMEIDTTIKSIKPVSFSIMNAEGVSELKKVQTDIVNLMKSIEGAYKTAINIKQQDTKATIDNEKAKQQQLKTEQEVIKTIQQEEKAEQQALKTKKLKNQETEAATKLSIREAKQAAELSNDYLQLSKAYNDAALKAKNYALTLGEQHPITQQAVKDARDMYNILYRVDASVGQHTRNVGNYASAFNGLNASFAQVARELPSLTVSAQQFFLAISNNLPIMADEIARAKTEIAGLKAEGKDTPSLFQRISGALFSWQTLLSVGITLLVAYGAELVKWAQGMIQGADASERAANQLEEYSKQADAAKSSLANLNNELQNLQQIYNVNNRIRFFGNDAQANLTETRNNLAFTIEGYNNLNRAIEENERIQTEARIRLNRMEKRGDTEDEEAQRAYQAFEKITNQVNELYDERAKKEGELEVARRQVALAEKQFREEEKKKAEEQADEESKRRKDALEKYKESLREQLSALNEFNKALLAADLNKLQSISNNEDALTTIRILALKKYLDLKSASIKKDAENEIIINNSTAAQALAIRQKASNDIQELETTTQQKITEIKIKSDKDTKKKMLDNEEKFQNSIIAMGDQTLKRTKQNHEEEIAGAKLVAEKKLEIEKQYQQNKQALVQKEIELAEQLAQLTGTFIDAKYDREKNQIQDLMDLNNKRYSQEIENIQNSTLSEEDKANRITILKAEQEAQTVQLEKKQRDISVQQAKFNKAMQVASVVAQTIQTVAQIQGTAAIAQAQALALLTNPFTVALYPAAQAAVALITAQIPIAIALGAISVGKILATPVPRYERGVKDAPGGASIVSERGQELYVSPSGKMFFTPQHPSLMYVERGATIVPNHELQNIFSSQTIKNIITSPFVRLSNPNNYKPLLKELQDGLHSNAKTIVNGIRKSRPIIRNSINISEQLKFEKWVDTHIRGK